jgi:hypothetical protein
MPTHQQILHFRTFGFTVFRGLLDPAEVAALAAEVTDELSDAFGGVGTDTDPEATGGIRGDYLPLAVDRAPLSQSLIADDPRLFQASAALVGGPTVPSVGIATCFTSNAGWHTDQGPDVGGVKFLAHLAVRTADIGPLQVIPGSHDHDFARLLCAYRAEDPATQGFDGWPWPATIVESAPGDVIAVDVHLLHASAGGTNRVAWTIEYLPWPGLADADRMRTVRDLTLDAVEFDHETYDRDRWPTWREWVAGASGIPSRQTAVERLRLLGVLADENPE